ncbi:Cytokine receptor-like factor 2 [Manis javanica]|nr:Cytokine receptor-like factor 2 [Manis javanica]
MRDVRTRWTNLEKKIQAIAEKDQGTPLKGTRKMKWKTETSDFPHFVSSSGGQRCGGHLCPKQAENKQTATLEGNGGSLSNTSEPLRPG